MRGTSSLASTSFGCGCLRAQRRGAPQPTRCAPTTRGGRRSPHAAGSPAARGRRRLPRPPRPTTTRPRPVRGDAGRQAAHHYVVISTLDLAQCPHGTPPPDRPSGPTSACRRCHRPAPDLDSPPALYWELIPEHGEGVGVICSDCLTLREQRAIRHEKGAGAPAVEGRAAGRPVTAAPGPAVPRSFRPA